MTEQADYSSMHIVQRGETPLILQTKTKTAESLIVAKIFGSYASEEFKTICEFKDCKEVAEKVCLATIMCRDQGCRRAICKTHQGRTCMS